MFNRGGGWGAGSALVGLALLAVACTDEPVRDDAGVVINPGEVSVLELRPGDCLDPDPDVSGEVSHLPVVPCEEAHLQEVFAVVTHPEDAYPGAAGVAAFADVACPQELEDRFGLSLADGVLFSYLLPSFDGWNADGDRDIVCVLVFPERDEVTGSLVAGTKEIPVRSPLPPVGGGAGDGGAAEPGDAGEAEGDDPVDPGTGGAPAPEDEEAPATAGPSSDDPSDPQSAPEQE